MYLSYTYFIASIPRYIDINPAKDYQLKQNSTLTFLFSYHKKSVQIYLLIQTYIDQLICSANNLTGFYTIRCSFAQGTLALRKGLWLCTREQNLVKVTHGTMKFLVIGVLENNTNSLKIMWRSLFLVKLHMKACNFIKNTRSLQKLLSILLVICFQSGPPRLPL